MASEFYGSEERQRLSNNEFVELIPHLSLDDIKLVEYRIRQWCPLIQERGNKENPYACNLCSVNVKSTSDLSDHLGGAMHNAKLKSVNELYHPDYTYFRKSETINETPINLDIDIKKEKEDVDETKDNENKQIVKKISVIPAHRLLIQSEDNGSTKESSGLPSLGANKQKRQNNDLERPKQQRQSKMAKLILNPAATLKKTPAKPSTNNLSRNCISKVNRTGSKDRSRFTEKMAISDLDDDKTQALVGVEYVVQILGSNTHNPLRYECSLCELVLNELAMQSHLVGYNHRLKYCTKHFPTAIQHYNKFIDTMPEHFAHRVMISILEKVSYAIEQYHGRQLPYEVSESEFQSNRNCVLSKVFSFRHPSDRNGPSFLNVVDINEISRLKSRVMFNYKKPCNLENNSDEQTSVQQDKNIVLVHPSVVQNSPNVQMAAMSPHTSYPFYPSFNDSARAVDDQTHKKLVEDFLRHTTGGTKPSTSVNVHIQNKRSYPHANRHYASRNPPYQQHYHKGKNKQKHPYDKDSQMKDLDRRYELYRKNPEAHPMYNTEWQSFWQRRKNELISAGFDHRTYNFQPEWVNFFQDRIEQLYSEEREYLKMPVGQRMISSGTTISVNRHSQSNKTTPRERSSGPQKSQLPGVNEVNGSTSSIVVSVLRLLTALEEQLGSLGPKVVELLSKALQAEKINSTKVNSIILTVPNCTILETAMEKFKGLILAGLLDSVKERALRKAITEIDKLLQLAEKDRKENDDLLSIKKSNLGGSIPPNEMSTLSAPPQVHSQKELNSATSSKAVLLENLDKKQLATHLASMLRAQGTTNINPDQLQQLISVYTALEKKKQEANAKSAPTITSNQKALSDTLKSFLASSPSSGQKSFSNLCKDNTMNNVHERSIPQQIAPRYSNPNISSYMGNTSNTMQSFGSNINNSSMHNYVPNNFNTFSYGTPNRQYPNNMPNQHNSGNERQFPNNYQGNQRGNHLQRR